MPIILPESLPARAILKREGVTVLDPNDGAQESAVKIGVLNLMPEKMKTEVQLARVLAASEKVVEMILLKPDSYRSRTTPHSHIQKFYTPFTSVQKKKFTASLSPEPRSNTSLSKKFLIGEN